MKSILIIAGLVITVNSFNQSKLINVSPDSCKDLIIEAEKCFNTTLSLADRSDAYQSFTYTNATHNIYVKLNPYTDTTKQLVEYIVISGTNEGVEKLFNDYIKTIYPATDSGQDFITTNSFNAVLTDDKSGLTHNSEIWITAKN